MRTAANKSHQSISVLQHLESKRSTQPKWLSLIVVTIFEKKKVKRTGKHLSLLIPKQQNETNKNIRINSENLAAHKPENYIRVERTRGASKRETRQRERAEKRDKKPKNI